ncbi:sensor histidine kinase [Halobellus rubicundus]|uniref:histidine kinase n=1 Tax=Halobellus rubicundus TaxID=2996466 RepID=A0ABD5MCM7_9EURY
MTTERTPADGSPLSIDELRGAFDAVTEAVFVHRPDGTIVDVNAAAADLYGHSPSALRDGAVETLSAGVDPYTHEEAVRRIERTAETGEARQFEWRARDSDGARFWVSMKLSRIDTDDGPRVLAVVRDIQGRKEAERRFQTLIENLPGVVYRCRNEAGWPMEFVGGRCAELTGYESETVESGAVSWGLDVIHPEDRERVDAEVQTAVDEGSAFEVTYRIRTADGSIKWMWERGQHLDGPTEGPEYLEGFITDITDRKRYEDRLEAQRDDLELLNQVLRHDIRNDLQLVTAYADLLADECDDSQIQEYIDTISEHAEHTVELTTTARDMANVLISDSDPESRRLRPVLESEVDEIRSGYPEAVVRCESIPDVEVVADDLLGSVFRNVLKNAVQHNDKDVPEVSVGIERAEGAVRIRVADNGPGVSDAQKESIFGKGEAGLDSAGTGIGLYLVRTLVDSYGGDVWVEDRDDLGEGDGPGAIFVVELPTES